MSDLINKLNVLIRATVNSSLPGGASADSRERGTLPRSPDHLSDQAVDAQISTLRQHIGAALDAEDGMRQKVENAQTQADQLDRQVDAALLDGDESNARVLAQRLQQQRQRLASQQADLEAHRRVTADLIEQVNQLEAQISDARANQAPELVPDMSGSDAPAVDRVEIPINTAPNPQSQNPAAPPTVRVPIKVKPAASSPNPPAAPTVPAASLAPVPRPVTSDPADTDADLARRRTRLSNPDKPDNG